MTGHDEERWIPTVHALHLAELLGRWGVTPAELFDGLGLDAATLSDPRGRLPIPAVVALVARAKALTGEPGIAFYLGLQMRVSAHGYLGFAAMTSSTVGEALEVAVRFAPTRTNAVGLHLRRDRDLASIVIEELAPLGAAAEAIVLALIVGIPQIGEALTGRRLGGTADVAFPAPAWVARFEHLLGGRIRFGQPAHQLVFDATVLDLPLVMRDPMARKLAEEQCERELDERGDPAKASARVRALLPRPDAGFLSLEETASRLGLSPRTLKRRLAEEGTDFSTLADDERRARTLLLLRSADLSEIEQVAARVGYSNVANFTRAFRRWTGATPAAHRRAALKGDA